MLGHRTLTPKEYISILKRRAWLIAVPVVVCSVAAYFITFLLSAQYVSQTLVLVEQQTIPDNYVKPIVTEDLNGRLASMKEQILSRSRLEPIIDRFNLYGKRKVDMDERIAIARKNIQINPIQSDITRSGGLPGFFISFQAEDARTAQLVCGEITSMFVNANLHSQEQSAEDTSGFLKEQLDGAKRDLDQQDAKLAAFQTKYFGKLPDQEQANLNMLSSLGVQLDASNQSLARMEQDLSYQQSLLTQQVHDMQLPQQKKMRPQDQQMELQQLLKREADLKTRYTDSYPDVITTTQKIQDLKKEMAQAPVAADAQTPSVPSSQEPESVQQLRAQIRAQQQRIAQQKHNQAAIQGQIRLYQDRIQSSPQVQEEFKELTRDYQTAQKFYDDLLTKMNQSKMAIDLQQRQQGEQFRVMDQPNLPDAPIFPKKGVFVAMGLAMGLALGLLVTCFLEYRDTTLSNEQDIWAFTKLPTIAVIGNFIASDANTNTSDSQKINESLAEVKN